MSPIDWRELYASNQAVIKQAGVTPAELPALPNLPELPKLPGLPGLDSGLTGGAPGGVAALRKLRDLPGIASLRGRHSKGAGGAPQGWEPWTSTVAGRTRRAWVHAPAGVDAATPVPLVCMLHGCTQDPVSFAAATRMNEAADEHGFAVVYPEQPRAENAQGCWNWFEAAHQSRGGGEPASI